MAAELPTGIVQRADLTGMTKEEALMSGVADVAENVMPAIVSITMTSVQNVEDWFRGRLDQMEQKVRAEMSQRERKTGRKPPEAKIVPLFGNQKKGKKK